MIGVIVHDGTMPASGNTDNIVLEQGHTYIGETSTIPSTNSPPALETDISLKK